MTDNNDNNPHQTIDWNDVIKKEARGSNGEDLGEVQETGTNYVLTQKGMLNKEKFYLPKELVEGYDGNALYFKITEEEAKNQFIRDSPPTETEYEQYGSAIPEESPQTSDTTTRVPVVEERLNVNKREIQEEAIIIKEPVTETKTVEVPLTHEEIIIQKRPATGNYPSEGPVQSKTEIRIPVKREEIEVTKEPYVKEEVEIQKKSITETKTVKEQITSEKVDVEGTKGTEVEAQ